MRSFMLFSTLIVLTSWQVPSLAGDEWIDDFEDGVIDESLWKWDGVKRGQNGPNQGEWKWSIEEITAQDGFLNMHVWGPRSASTFGAEAWLRTLYDYNNGSDHTVRFSWEAIVNVPSENDHFNRYFVQITDGYISPDGNVHWTRCEAPIPGTANLLTDPDGKPGKRYPDGREKSEWTMTITASGDARLYDEQGDLVNARELDPSFPWHLRFMVIDATSSGFPAGDIEMNLYDFSSRCGTPCEPCDANCDGDVDLLDIDPFIDLLLGGEPCGECAGDANGDGSVDLTDIGPFIECLLG